MRTVVNSSNSVRVLAALVFVAGLSSCERAGQEPDADTAIEEEPVPAATESPISILREDIEAPEVVEPLEPLEERIGFSDGGAELSDQALTKLKDLLTSRQMAEGGPIILRAHSDAGGDGDANIRASQARGEAVRDWLVENGINPERIEIIAFGEQNPIEPNARPDGSPNEAGRAANRRVDILIDLQSDEAGPADDTPPAE